MEPGRFRHRVTLLNSELSRDDYGQETETWQESVPFSADVNGISGRELISAGAETAEVTLRVWCRYRSDITAASQLRCISGPFKGQILDITGPPIPDRKGQRLEILCKQGVKR